MKGLPCWCQARGGHCDENHCEHAASATFDVASMCRVCWLYHHVPAFRKLWAGAFRPPGKHFSLECSHRGEQQGQVKACGKCYYFHCTLHQVTCTRIGRFKEHKACLDCPDRTG